MLANSGNRQRTKRGIPRWVCKNEDLWRGPIPKERGTGLPTCEWGAIERQNGGGPKSRMISGRKANLAGRVIEA